MTAIKIVLIILVIGAFSGLVLSSYLEAPGDIELYKVKLWKHGKTSDKVCWNKDCYNKFKKY